MNGFFILHFLIICFVISSSALFFYNKVSDIYYYKTSTKKICNAKEKKEYHVSKIYSSLDETGIEIGVKNDCLISIEKNYHEINSMIKSLYSKSEINDCLVLSKPVITFDDKSIYVNNNKIPLKSRLEDKKIIDYNSYHFDKRIYVVFKISSDENLLIVELDSKQNYLNDFITCVGIQTKSLIVSRGEKYYLFSINENFVKQYTIQGEKLIQYKKKEFSSNILHAKPLYHLSNRSAGDIYFILQDGKIFKLGIVEDYQIEVGFLPNVMSFHRIFIIYSYSLNRPLICCFDNFAHNLLMYAELYSGSLEAIKFSNLSVKNYVEIIPYGEYLWCLSSLNYRYDKVFLDDFLPI